MVLRFRGPYFFLSNFYPCKLKYKGITFKCAEAAYFSMKCRNPYDRYKYEFLDGPQAKALSKRVLARKDWETVNHDIMYDVLFQKFYQNPELVNKLLDTGNCDIIEGNDWGDTHWGVCNGVGENHLGKIIMELRDNFNDGVDRYGFIILKRLT